MRLLNTSTLQVETVPYDKIPSYAILSHTWGSDEVTFQDLQELQRSELSPGETHSIEKRQGYAKIHEAARLAKSEGHQFIWIDTCCIDKTSSAELSEAINSMFQWYQEAKICYAFLSDVPAPRGISYASSVASHDIIQEIEPTSVTPIDQDTNTALRNSRWFTRGWTLQELIAPRDVKFVSQNWTPIGHKLDGRFARLLYEITGISGYILRRSAFVDEVSVAGRMRWAAGRETTRAEDIAYCLIGIFGVNMPLLYGEGPRAFIRLQEEILRQTNDQSLFAWLKPEINGPGMLSGLSGLLAPSPTCFQLSGGLLPPKLPFSLGTFPSSMTNAGLHVRLYLKLVPCDIPNFIPLEMEYEAILDCICDIDPTSIPEGTMASNWSPTIRLSDLGGGQYARVKSNKLYTRPSPLPEQRSSTSDATPNEEGFRYVYIRQNPVAMVPDICVTKAKNTGQHTSTAEHELIEIYPDSRWNNISGVFTPQSSRLGSVVAAFRYVFSASDSSRQVDFFIGLGRSDSGTSWNYWCTQQRVDGNVDLETSFLEMEQTVAEGKAKNFSWGCEEGGITALNKWSITQDRHVLYLQVSWQPELLHTNPSPVRVIHATSEIFYSGSAWSVVER